jgi:NAD(P)-dependent dehydrogenase (short-subunit alcohol dehydrogenase family)
MMRNTINTGSAAAANQPVAVITGASRGIGRVLALGLLEAGSHVLAIGRDAGALEELRRAASGARAKLVCVAADVATEAGRARIEASVAAEFGYLTCLVNNAAIGMGSLRRDYHDRPVTHAELNDEILDRFLNTNARAPIVLAIRLLPLFRLGWGRIIIIGTSFNSMHRLGFIPYGMSKAALESASAILAQELKDSGVTVNVINPGGPVNTPMVARSDQQQRDLLISPGIMVKPVCWLASRAADGVTGRRITATRWSEAAMDEAMAPIGWPQLAADSTWQAPQ